MEGKELLSYLSSIVYLEQTLKSLKAEKTRLEEQVIPRYGVPIDIISDYSPKNHKEYIYLTPQETGWKTWRKIWAFISYMSGFPFCFAVLSLMFLSFPWYMLQKGMNFSNAAMHSVLAGIELGIKLDGIIILIFFIRFLFVFIVNRIIDAINSRAKESCEQVIAETRKLDQKRIDAENKYCKNYIIPHYEFVTEHHNLVEKQLAKLYDKNILYPTFRGLIPVTQIYEYIASGICFELTGPNGAYAQYMNDVRTNRIVHKLDQLERSILYRLDQIISNQYTLITGIQESNRVLSELDAGISSISNQVCNVKQLLTGIENNTIKASQYMQQSQIVLENINKEINQVSYNTAINAFNNYVLAQEQQGDNYWLQYPLS